MFKLKFPNDKANHRCRKDTIILTNVQGLSKLGLRCDGKHFHTAAQGYIKHNGRLVSRTKLAGHYPSALCRAWVAAVASL
jgi:hypothetical protein